MFVKFEILIGVNSSVLCLFLGVALEMRGGRDDRALDLLTIPGLFQNVNPINVLLGRASLSRLYRRLEMVFAAVAQYVFFFCFLKYR